MRTLRQAVSQAREDAVTRALARTGGNVAAAARQLGVQKTWAHAMVRRSKKLRRELDAIRARAAETVRKHGRRKGGEA